MKKVRILIRKLPILVLFLIFGCQNDSLIESNQEETLKTKSLFKSSTIFKNDIATNYKLSTKMNNLLTSKNDLLSKSVYNETYNFTINTDVAKLVESVENNSHSYTFSVSRENNSDSNIENLVFSYNESEDSYEAGLVTYHFSADQRQEYLINSYVSTPYDISFESLEINISDVLSKSTQMPCTVTYQEYHIPNGSTNSHLHTTNGHVNNVCEHGNDEIPCETYTVITITCPTSGSSPNGNGTDDNTTGEDAFNGSTSGGNSNSGNNETDFNEPSDDIIVTSLINDEEAIRESILNCINGLSLFNTVDLTTIDPEILELNDLTISELRALKNHLQDNECSELSQQEVIEILIDAYDEYQIINELHGKTLCVYNKLKSSSIGFKNSIKLFDSEFPVAHLKYVNSSTLPSSVNAETSPPSNFLINIAINENNLNRPNISIARTIIHETIHAEMFRKILSILDNGGDLDGLTRTEWINKLSNGDYPGIYDYFVRFGANGMQHEQMAAHYRNVIVNMLIEFQPGLSQNIYEALAWVGLKNTETWNALTDAEKATINSTINTFNATGAEQCN